MSSSEIYEADKDAFKAQVREKDAPQAVVRDRRVNSSGSDFDEIDRADSNGSSGDEKLPPSDEVADEKMQKPNPDRKWWHAVKEPGSALQIIIAAALAIGIAVGVSEATEVPQAAITILLIPGNLWLRALTCVGESTTLRLPLIARCLL